MSTSSDIEYLGYISNVSLSRSSLEKAMNSTVTEYIVLPWLRRETH